MSDKKILLIEDEIFLRELYVQVLEQAGYTVLAAHDGEAGIELVNDNLDADLILLDIMLPKKHGVDVLKQLKADQTTQKIPIVMLSNLSDEKIIKETLKLGARGYLVKVQVSPEQLIARIKSYVI